MRISLPWTTVFADTTTERSLPATGWFEGCGDVLACRGTFDFNEDMDPIEVGIGIECVNVESEQPTSAVVLARAASTGMQYGTSFTGVSATTASKRLFRFVWLCARGSTSGLVMARVGGYVDIETRNG